MTRRETRVVCVDLSAMKARPRKPPTGTRPASPSSKDSRPRHRGKTEEMYHGLRACEAIFATRPEEIVRVYVAHGRQKQLAKLLAWCAKEKKGYQIVTDESLARLTKSIHHEGVAILARQIRRWDLDMLLASLAPASVGKAARAGSHVISPPVLYLDGVQNPHNLGSILRTAAHFGAAAVIGKAGDLPPLSPAAVRVAEGAAEHVPVCDCADPVRDLARLKKAGYQVVATSSRRGEARQRGRGSVAGDRRGRRSTGDDPGHGSCGKPQRVGGLRRRPRCGLAATIPRDVG